MPAQLEPIAWEQSLEQAERRAAREGRCLLIDFSAAPLWSGCVAMDTVTYPDHRVAEFIGRHCVPFKVDVRKYKRLAEEYLVSWTPNVVIADEQGKAQYRVEGYLPPEEFLAHLSLGVGKCLLFRKKFKEAAERFEEVAERHRGSEMAAEALYWRGVAGYKENQDASQLQPSALSHF